MNSNENFDFAIYLGPSQLARVTTLPLRPNLSQTVWLTAPLRNSQTAS